MKVDDYKVEAVLKEGRRFVVPLYQRQYQWREDRLNPFWRDVEEKALDLLSNDSKHEHYMGALIIAPVDIGLEIGKTPMVEVVDGQQRLTTFQLFLAALREVARRHDYDDMIQNVESYLYNTRQPKDPERARFKLTPTLPDRDQFNDFLDMDYGAVIAKYNHLLLGNRVPKNRPHHALRAYIIFNSLIEKFALEEPDDDITDHREGEDSEDSHNHEIQNQDETIHRRLDSLLNAVLGKLKLVVIELDKNDDAQVIFETLNSMGEPLLAMDLVRNNIFLRAKKQEAEEEELYNRLWSPFDHEWWKTPAPNARPRRPRIDHFLAHTLVAEKGQKISIRELYTEYKDFAFPEGKARFADVEGELELLNQYVPIYKTLEGENGLVHDDGTLHWFGSKMATWQVTTVYPVAMRIAKSAKSQEDGTKLLRLLYSYLVRRDLCGLTSKRLNIVFQELAGHFVRTEDVSVSSFKTFFAGKQGDSSRFPSDGEVKLEMPNLNAYHKITPRPRLTDILGELERESCIDTDKADVEPLAGLTVEHVLPQKWADGVWPFPNEEGEPPESEEEKAAKAEEYAAKRNHTLHTLGNLTLASRELNTSVSNTDFDNKKAEYKKHSKLFLNDWFQSKGQWTEDEIAERGKSLADKAVEIWPSLESVK